MASINLDQLPLDDPAALAILNRGRMSGIFQFAGSALKGLTAKVRVDSFEDMVALTALARPGPMDSGAADVWVRRRNGTVPVEYPHSLFEPLLKGTWGVMLYQEQIMQIAREIGGLSWEDVTGLRKAIGKSQGREAIDRYGDQWKAGAEARGVPPYVAQQVWSDIVTFGRYAFNRSHAVAYSYISYWCCWLKAHHPLEFAAATLDAATDPDVQIAILRELHEEGISYVAVDPDRSGARWVVSGEAGHRILVGPLTAIKGIGPAKVNEILFARAGGAALKPALAKMLETAQTPIDSLWPIRDRVRSLHPDLAAINIVSEPVAAELVQAGFRGSAMVIGRLNRLNEKEDGSLNLFLSDDSGEIFAKIDRRDIRRLGPLVTDTARIGKSLYAVKGTVPPRFRMLKISNLKHLGEMDQ